MREEARRRLLCLLVALIIFVGGVLSVNAWRSTVIIADTTPPRIDRDKTTHGYMAYQNPVTLKCVVHENVEMDYVEATVYSPVGFPPSTTVTFTLLSHSGDTYVYTGEFSADLGYDQQYEIVYVAVDKAGHTDTFSTTLMLTDQIRGYVTINGQQAGPNDKIVVKSLRLDIRVYITVGADAVESVYGQIDGTALNFENKSGYWQKIYQLPGDGVYELIVKVKDKTGAETRLASFTIEIHGQQQIVRWTFVAAVVAVFGAIGAVTYMKRREKGAR